MSPKFLDQNGFSFHIFSREEDRCHVHIRAGSKKAKYWLEPTIELSENKGFKQHELSKIEKIITENEQDFKTKFNQHLR